MNALLIGKKLRDLRGERSQKEVCEATGIRQTALSNYEKGKRIPRDETKEKLAKYYHVSTTHLFFDH